jgi:hypothetical protein
MSDDNQERQSEQESIPDTAPQLPGHVLPTEREQSSYDPGNIEKK